MSRDATAILRHPIEAGHVDLPTGDVRALFLGAVSGLRLPESVDGRLQSVQGFRPDYLALEGATPEVPAGDFDMTMVLTGRHRGENELRIATALERTVPGGLILVAGAKEDGAASLKKRLAGLIEIEGHTPKHHGLAFWFRSPADAAAVAAILRAENPDALVEGRFRTGPGMFSHGEIDRGSRFLVENLPKDMAGNVADFCAGWGYLAASLIERCPQVNAVDLYEADFASLEAAKDNLAGAAKPIRFFWHDLLSEPVGERYDAVVMNPPFHRGHAGDPEIGQGMIRAASSALRKGGRLYMVANRNLPYEAELAACFSRFSTVAEDSRFKVLVAVL